MSNAQELELDFYLSKIRTAGPQARTFMNALKVSGPCISSYIGRNEVAGVSCTGAPALVIYDADAQPVSIVLMVKNTDAVYEDVLLPGAELAGCFGRVGPGSGTIVVVETYCAGLVIHSATGLSVAVALFAENLVPVVSALNKRHPGRTIIVCTNNTEGSVGKSNQRQAIAAALVCKARVAIPTACTFDEQFRQEGDESVRASIVAAVAPSTILFPEVKEMSGIPDAPTPWPNAVNGSAVIENMLAVFNRHLIMSMDAKVVLAMWVIFTHVFTVARVAPILALLSPVRRCGKTTVIQILASLVSRPYPCSNVTAAVLFRTVDLWQPTMLLDEVDTYLTNSDHALTGIINSGHTPATAFVTRIEKGKPVRFNTHCPKMLAAIGRIPETISDRSVTIRARRKRPDEHVDKFPPQSNGLILALRAQVERWVKDNISHIAAAQPAPLNSGNDRTDDNFEILLAIAQCIGGAWPDRVKAAALALAVRHDEIRAGGIELLGDIRMAFASAGKSRLRTIDLIAGICDDAEKLWFTYSKGKPITPREIAALLTAFEIQSKNLRYGEVVSKGYELSDFEDAFARYCCPDT
jgi:hypothetical protein